MRYGPPDHDRLNGHADPADAEVYEHVPQTVSDDVDALFRRLDHLIQAMEDLATSNRLLSESNRALVSALAQSSLPRAAPRPPERGETSGLSALRRQRQHEDSLVFGGNGANGRGMPTSTATNGRR